LSTVRTQKLATTYGLELHYTFFPLHPDTPQEGLLLADLFRGRNFDLDAVYARMKGLMDAEGLAYSRRDRTYNSRLAQELGKWGESRVGDAIHTAFYRACHVDGRNLAERSVLLDVVGQVGLDVKEAEAVLTERTFRAAIDADWRRAREMGVTGVPTFVAGQSGVVGAQPYEVLERLVQAAGARKVTS